MVEEIYDRRFSIEETENYNAIDAHIYYSKERKQYTLNVIPVKFRNMGGYSTVTCCPMDGINIRLNTVTRKSKKGNDEAVRLAESNLPFTLKNIAEKFNLTIKN